MIALDRLIAYAAGDLSGDDELTVEEHVLSCGACAAVVERLVRLGSAIRELVRAGALDGRLIGTPALVAKLDAEGLIHRRYHAAPGQSVACSVGADDVFAVLTLEVPLAGVSRVDFVHNNNRFADVPFDAANGRLYIIAPSGSTEST
jgi:anti-sigma factor RsiW